MSQLSISLHRNGPASQIPQRPRADSLKTAASHVVGMHLHNVWYNAAFF